MRLSTAGPSWPSACDSENFPVGLAEDELHGDELRAWIVPGVRVGEEVDLFVVGVADALEHLLADTGPGSRATEKPDNRGALGAAVTGIASGDDVGCDAALAVRRAGQRDEVPLSGPEILDLDGVADGEDIRVAGAHVLIHADAAAFTDSEAGRLGQRRVRPHAECEDDDVGRILFAGLRLHLERGAVHLCESGHAVIERQVHAVSSQMAFDEVGHLAVHWREYLVKHLDETNVEAEVDKVLGHFEADESAADHHRMAGGLHHLDSRVVGHSGEKRSASFHPLANRPGIRHGPDMKDPGQINTGQRRAYRRRSGRQHQLVVGLGRDLAGVDIAQVDRLLLLEIWRWPRSWSARRY